MRHMRNYALAAAMLLAGVSAVLALVPVQRLDTIKTWQAPMPTVPVGTLMDVSIAEGCSIPQEKRQIAPELCVNFHAKCEMSHEETGKWFDPRLCPR